MDIIGVIPARLASSRLSHKLVRTILGKPLIQWTWEAAHQARTLDDLIIACDSPQIYEMAKEFGYIAAVMIFFALAEIVSLEKFWEYKVEIFTMFIITTLIRAISMAKFAFWGSKLEQIKPVGFEGWFILTFSGMKGALSIILVHMIPASFEHKELFEVVTTGVVMMSIFVYGTVLWGYFTFFKKEEEKKLFMH